MSKVKRPRRVITIECQVIGCKWTATANTWRPARRLRDAHTAEKHR